VMLNVTYAKESATTSVLYIPNYNSDFTWDFVNPVPAFPRLGEAIVPCGRLVGSVSNVTKCRCNGGVHGLYSASAEHCGR
jgi:hypothetical protein